MWRKQTASPPPPAQPLKAPSSPLASPLSAPPTIHSSEFASRSHAFSGDTSSQVAPGLNIRGSISGGAPLAFEGILDGPIHLRDADLIIGPRGVVRGAIQAREIQIEGTVEGKVTADVRILLLPDCNVTGQLTSPHIAIEDGAVFSGRVEMVREESDAAPAEPEYEAAPELKPPRDVEGEAPPLFAGKRSTPPDSSVPDLEADKQSETGAEIPLLREES